MKINIKKSIPYISGLIAGFINSLLGAGGSIIVVSFLSKFGLEQKKSHATSVAILLPICILNSIIYINGGKVKIEAVFPYILWGILGSLFGSFILSKINVKLLKIIFGLVIVFSGFKMLFK